MSDWTNSRLPHRASDIAGSLRVAPPDTTGPRFAIDLTLANGRPDEIVVVDDFPALLVLLRDLRPLLGA